MRTLILSEEDMKKNPLWKWAIEVSLMASRWTMFPQRVGEQEKQARSLAKSNKEPVKAFTRAQHLSNHIVKV